MRFFGNETGNSMTGVLVLGGGILAGVNVLDQGRTLGTLTKQTKQHHQHSKMDQNILSASAIMRSLVCGEKVEVVDNSFRNSGSNYTANNGSLIVSLDVPQSSKSFDAVFNNRKAALETKDIAFTILRNNLPNSLEIAAKSSYQGAKRSSNLKIDCEGIAPSAAETVAEDENNFTTEIALGIGYEDGGDNDFNDIVMCIEGQFAVNVLENKIVSLKNQNIDFFFKRLTGQTQHIMRLFENEIGDRKMVEIKGLAFGQEAVRKLSLKKGQTIRMALGHPGHRSLRLSKGIDHRWAKVEKDVCRNTGR